MKALDWHPQWSIAETIRENFRFFGAGGIVDPDSSLYHNTKRMERLMQLNMP